MDDKYIHNYEIWKFGNKQEIMIKYIFEFLQNFEIIKIDAYK